MLFRQQCLRCLALLSLWKDYSRYGDPLDALGNKIMVSLLQVSAGMVKGSVKRQKSRQPDGECLILVGLIYS